MENFIVSARKYRPKDFSSVVGQESITTTLENAIKNNHLAQAFLFCGPRGVGKTTCARILARIINQENSAEESQENDYSFNIFELDAASNNSVDDIRNLIDQVRIPPQVGTHKVYIIDEVHMLSQAAFNAFLKTLEEPPAHAIFILATTEKHKIIPTILSRCQIFDFNRIQVQDITNHLKSIAEKEEIAAEEDALHIIAQKADGSLRDGLSIFDQIVSFAGNNVTYKAVIDNLNILDYDYYFKAIDFFLEGNTAQALLLFNQILNNGFDGHNFVAGLAEHIRNLLVCKDEATISLLEVGENIKNKYFEQAKNCDEGFLLQCLQVLNECDVQYKTSKNKKLRVELALLKLCSILSTAEKKTFDEKVKIKKAEPKQENDNKATSSSTAQAPKNAVKEEKNLEEVDEKKEAEDIIKSQGESVKKVSLDIKSTNKPPQEQEIEDTPDSTVLSEEKKSYKPKTTSIADMVKQANSSEASDSSEEEEEQKEVLQGKFSYDDLTNAWAEFAKTIEEEQPSLYKILVRQQPALKEESIIEFTVKNAVEQEMFTESRHKLQEYLADRLNNNQIELNTVLEMEENEGRKLYTTRDKYLYLLNKNPNLKKLKDKLDLDIDF